MNNYEIYVLRMDKQSMEKAKKAYEACKTEWEKITNEWNELPPVTLGMDGFKAVQERQELAKQYDERKEAATKKALEVVEECKKTFIDFIDKQITPTGELMSACMNDNMLLVNDLVETEKQLSALADTWKDNCVMRKAIKNYAASKEWKGFELVTHDESLKEFAESYFNSCVSACNAPLGSYYALWFDEEGALLDQIRAFDLLREYNRE